MRAFMGRFAACTLRDMDAEAISNHLMGLGVETSKSSVERLIKGRGSYTGRQVPVKETTP